MIIYNNIMFSKRNSNILKNDPNSMFDIGKKLSHTSIRNISIDNPSENPNMQLALNKINALPTIAPTTLNKFAITKSNNIQKNVDIEEFILSINEADKTLQTISIIVNNIDSQQILTGGAENDNKKSYSFGDHSNIFKDDDDEEIPWFDDVDDDNTYDEEYEKAIKIEKQAELEQLDNQINHIKSFDFIYLQNDPDKIIEQMRIFKSNLNYKERIAAEKYLFDIYPDANKLNLLTKYIPDNIDELPSKETRDNDIKSIQKERDNVYNELNPKKSKSVKIETKPSKPINPKKSKSVEIETEPSKPGISNKKVYSSKSDNFNIPYKFETEPSKPKISGIRNKKVYSEKPDNFNIPVKIETEPQQSINEQNINEQNINNEKLKNLIEQFNIEKQKEDIYNLPNADKIINEMKIIYRNRDKKSAKKQVTRAINNLRQLYPEGNIESPDDLPDDIINYIEKDKYQNNLKYLSSEINKLKLEKTTSKLEKKNKSIINSIDYLKSKEPILNAMTKFNSQINRLLIFFKGKIKPNLKIISKNDISEALEDMDILNQNFKDVYLQVHNKFHNIFGVKRLGNKQSDQFLETFASNFNKISSEIISGFKAYSNISSYSQGGFLLPSVVRQNVFKGNKYLL